ncbi:adhesin biosynthesis transcription regulatory family protein [Shewanella subflava]|uniref:Adhesin biosynthesis transcription regulatory family protein n=1 Tax=Shewanella subflava TaxID=2986476 RepID=A0ABT3I5P6_9GAMM|nr:adhesin biosynthesis transcription regulatory family protein [Shewanella subflava]MCW3171393.1 adhesin biosynthesis transcription regulatory family protein [Shewanella subflava]
MKYLIQGGESTERLQLLLQLTNIESDNIKSALHDHFVTGHPDSVAAIRNEVKKSNLSRAMKRIEEVAGTVEQIKELDWDKFKPSKVA